MHFYNHHIGDFDKATRHLTRIERSIYRDLRDLYYDTEAPLTLDRVKLCRKIIVRSDEEATAVEQVLNEFFIETETGWFHTDIETDLVSYRASTSQKSAAGKASAAKKAALKHQALSAKPAPVQRSLNAHSTTVEIPLNDDPTNQKPPTINQEPGTELTPKPTSPPGGGEEPVKPFDRFWEAWPNKVAKVAAQKAWAKLKPDAALLDTILAAIEAQKLGHHWRQENGQYIGHPASWLNGGRWMDVVTPYVEPKKDHGRWWATKDTMAAFALTLSPPLKPNPGELPADFGRRIQASLDNDGAPAPAAQPTPYVPPAPVGGESVLTDEQLEARRQETRAAIAKMNGRQAPPQEPQQGKSQ